jgi:hypothetical protein
MVIIDLFHGRCRCIAKSTKSAHAHVNENHFVTTSPFRNGSHLPITQCACADFVDFDTQRNGGGSCEKDLYPRCGDMLGAEILQTCTDYPKNSSLAAHAPHNLQTHT